MNVHSEEMSLSELTVRNHTGNVTSIKTGHRRKSSE